MSVDINLGSKFDAKGFKQAETAIGKLNSNAKKLAGTLGLALGARALANYSKNAVKAFAADDKAARALTLTLDNLGLAFANPEVTKFISSLEKQFGVLDDELRPAYQKLLTATGDYKKAQDLLRTSLDLSAMSGFDVQSVTTDLTRAYAGNTRGLTKYALGLDKAQLAGMSFEQILTQIAKVSTGQADLAAGTYAGSIDKLNVAMAQASETIGKSLIDAIGILAGGDGLPKTIELIETLSEGFSRAITLSARVIRNFSILASGNPLESFRDLKEAARADLLADRQATAEYGGIYASIYQAQAKAFANGKKTLDQSKALTKETAEQLKNKKLQAAIDKANLAMNKGEGVFDLEKIQLAAAEKSQTEQLAKVTSQAQALQITNDLTRLRIKERIIALDEAIASGDVNAITAATNRLNEDLKIFGALSNQKIKLTEIEDILRKLLPKDLINLDNLRQAITLLGQIGGTGTTAVSMGTAPVMPSSLNPIAGAGGVRPSRGFTNEELNYFEARDQYQFGGSLSGLTPTASSAPVNITVNTGVGDPNAIAEAIDDVLRQAQQRGTLVALP